MRNDTGDLISRRALLEDIRSALRGTMYFNIGARERHEEKIQWALDRVKEIPAVDAVPVVHGSWYHGECSVCKGICIEYKPPFCPNCGAKMDEVRE